MNLNSQTAQPVKFVYFGERFFNESNGALGHIVMEEPAMQPATWDDLMAEILTGKNVSIRPADEIELAYAEDLLAKLKQQTAGQSI